MMNSNNRCIAYCNFCNDHIVHDRCFPTVYNGNSINKCSITCRTCGNLVEHAKKNTYSASNTSPIKNNGYQPAFNQTYSPTKNINC